MTTPTAPAATSAAAATQIFVRFMLVPVRMSLLRHAGPTRRPLHAGGSASCNQRPVCADLARRYGRYVPYPLLDETDGKGSAVAAKTDLPPQPATGNLVD